LYKKTHRVVRWADSKEVKITLGNNVFRPRTSRYQYLSARQRERLIRDYIWARDSYRKAVVDARRAYEELVKRGLIPDDNKKSEP
jgi:hypothetical protein